MLDNPTGSGWRNVKQIERTPAKRLLPISTPLPTPLALCQAVHRLQDGPTALTVVVIGPIASSAVCGIEGCFGSFEQRDGIVVFHDLRCPDT